MKKRNLNLGLAGLMANRDLRMFPENLAHRAWIRSAKMTLRVVLGLGLVFAQVLAESAAAAVGAEPVEIGPSSLAGGEIPVGPTVRPASASEVSILARDTQISTYGLMGLRDSRLGILSAAPLEQAQELGIPANSRIQVVEAGRGEDGLDYTRILINDEMLAWVATRDLAQVESLERTEVAGQTFITPVRGRITSRVGMRFHPVLRRRVYHAGTDYAAPIGTPVKAAADGVVSFSGRAGAYGIMIQINHAGGIFTRYAHLSRSHVSVGQRLTQGTLIGRVGNTGRSTGPHLHYERRRH